MMRRGVFFAIFLVLVLAGVVVAQSFDVSSLLLKVSVQEGDSVSKQMTVNAESDGDYRVSVIGIDGVSVDEGTFSLNKGESKRVSVNFDSKGVKSGVGVGSLRITGGGDTVNVPVVFEVESVDLFFDVNLDIPPQYTDVEPGERVIAQIKIFDLISGGTGNGLGATKVDMEYMVINLDGDVLSSESESVIVDGQTQISKTVSFPEDAVEGNYVFVAIANYASSVGTSSFVFSIKDEGLFIRNVGFGDREVNFNFLIAVIAILIFFIGIIVAFLYLLKDRDKLFGKLKHYHNWEMQKHKRLLKGQVKEAKSKKGVSAAMVRAQAKRRVEILKKKQKQRVREFARLRKLGDVAAMQRKLKEWQKEGYSTLGLQRDIKNLKKKAKKTRK